MSCGAQVTARAGERAYPSEGWAGLDLHPFGSGDGRAIVLNEGHENNGGRFLDMAPRVARIESDGGVVCERCVVADSFRLRLRGLMGRKSVGSDEGLLLVGSPSIHTSFMRFPIDAVFLDRELVVLRVVPRLRPWRAAMRRGSKLVLELAAGESDRRGIRPGEQLTLVEETG